MSLAAVPKHKWSARARATGWRGKIGNACCPHFLSYRSECRRRELFHECKVEPGSDAAHFTTGTGVRAGCTSTEVLRVRVLPSDQAIRQLRAKRSTFIRDSQRARARRSRIEKSEIYLESAILFLWASATVRGRCHFHPSASTGRSPARPGCGRALQSSAQP